MKILGLIPARGGSKGIPGKNIKRLGGKPLIEYAIAAGLASRAIERVVVSTDDETIAQLSRQLGAQVPFIRPADLATDQSPTIDTVIHAITFFQDQGVEFDAVCLLQATSPFRSAEDIRNAIHTFRQSGADALISVREVPHTYNPHWVFEEEAQSGYLK
ncbi:MAG: acylneuraminate cytidylyltransferase family protein, partial [Bacteroidota bacterium]